MEGVIFSDFPGFTRILLDSVKIVEHSSRGPEGFWREEGVTLRSSIDEVRPPYGPSESCIAVQSGATFDNPRASSVWLTVIDKVRVNIPPEIMR
jgi:hypothetical protein